jgi:hypothetical protein
MHGQTTNIRTMSLNNNAGGSEGSFLFKKKEAGASAADISKIKLRWPFITWTRPSSHSRLTLEVAPILRGKHSSKKP